MVSTFLRPPLIHPLLTTSRHRGAMRLVLILLCLLSLPLSAQASPWPRAAGGWFVSGTVGQERAASGWQLFGDVYVEYGATARLTLASQLRHGPGHWRGDLLARWHPGAGPGIPPFGLSAGIRLQPDGTDRALVLLAAHLGRGFDTRLGNVWTRLDLQTQTRPTQPASPVEFSLSGQLGIRSTRGLIAMASLTGKRRNGAATLELSPAIGHEIGRAHTLVLGLTASPSTPQVRSAQLSLWSRF